VGDLQVGKEYDGAIVSIRDFGAFVNIGVVTDGLLHISQVCDGPRHLLAGWFACKSRCLPACGWRTSQLPCCMAVFPTQRKECAVHLSTSPSHRIE
jgi:polyribonucleotide nucleotidyltransferase